MKLHYFRDPSGIKNFGDDLNPWLWDKLLSDVLDDDENTAFVGIGTLLNEWLPTHTPKAHKRVIFGTGVGYGGMGGLQIDNSYKVYCLRGPLSAQTLGLQKELAVTDAAVLVRRLINTNTPKVHRFAYMPHVGQIADEAWNSVCKEIGFGYIDPRWSTEKVLSCISQTEILLTEAMHGAIVADALRVPWIPIVTKPRVLSLKWQDWCMSIGVEYQPMRVARLIAPQDKRTIHSLAYSANNWVMRKIAPLQLVCIAKKSMPILSSDTVIEQLTVTLEERLQQFKDDLKTGVFSS